MTMLSWDLNAGSNNADKAEFTKFPVGITRIRVIDPAPHIRWTHWMPQFNKSVNCPGVRACPIDDLTARQKQNGLKPSYNATRRYAMNIFNYETNRVEVMDQGKTFMEDLKMIMQDAVSEGKQLSDLVLKVRRTGTSKDDTKYRIDILEDAKEPMPEGAIDLVEYLKPNTPEQLVKLISVEGNYDEAWKEIMTNQEDEKQDEEEDYEVK